LAQSSGAERFFGIAVTVVLLYFAHKAWPAINYFQNPFFIQALERQGGFWSLVSFAYQVVDNALLFLTLALVALEFIPDSEDKKAAESGDGTLLVLLVLWAFTGWYAGTRFDPGDTTKLSFMAFAFLSITLSILIGMGVVAEL